PEDVRFNAKSTWNTKQAVQIIEIDPKLEMLFNDVLDGNRRLHLQPCGVGILRKQGFGVAFNGLIGDVRHPKGHSGRSSSASSNPARVYRTTISPSPSAPVVRDGPDRRRSGPSRTAGNPPSHAGAGG